MPIAAAPRRRAALPAGLLALSLALWAACGPAGEPAPSGEGAAAGPRRGGTIVVGTITDIETFNELLDTSSRAFHDVGYQMFLHLLDEQPDFTEHPPSFAPELATSWEWSDDHLALTFHLREDAVWSDGVPVTAEDVRFTWEAQTSPEVAWDGAYTKESIEDVEVVAPHTVVFRFSRVSPTQLLDALEGVVLPKHAWGKLPFSEWRRNADFFRENLVVAGPYRLERWTPQQEIVLVRNERYFDPEQPYLDRVIFRIIPEKSNQVTQLLTGDLHLVEQIPRTALPRVRASERVRVEAFWHRSYAFILWNLEDPRFSEAEVRRALTLAIDRQQMVDTLWGDLGRVATSAIVHHVWAHDDSIEPMPYDPARARELLAAAGWRDRDGDGVIEKDGVPFAFDLVANQGNQERIDAVVMAQEQLRRVGIDARPRMLEFNAMAQSLTEGSFEAMIFAWAMPTTLDLRYAFHSSEIGAGSNFSRYSSPEVDRLIEEMERLPEIAQAEPILLQLQQLLHRDQPMTLLWESQRVNGVSRRLHGLDANVLSTVWFLRRWWLEPAG
ncbi:MAG TPA: ABC transporter substrate-binding protein [Thermoanaerobaculia bacterium]|nr:ABC transporter substrate-binding protein [Thermoanaerobaculia bacterium]